jgi:TonB family protein
MEYISKNIKYPVVAQENNVQGKVIVGFVINADGKVIDAVVLKSIKEKVKKLDEVVVTGYKAKNESGDHQDQTEINSMKPLEKEALRVVNAMSDWIPGEQNGKKVAVYYTLPINFRLQGDDSKTGKETGNLEFKGLKDGNKPLYIVDGKVVTENDFKAINPADIKQIDVLKDKNATALYGEQGKNGVIVVTGKK